MDGQAERDRAAYAAACAAAWRRDAEYRDLADAPAEARRHVAESVTPGWTPDQPDGQALRGVQAEGRVAAYLETDDGGAYAVLSGDGRACVVRLAPSARGDVERVYGGLPNAGDFLAGTYLRRECGFILDERRTLQFHGERDRRPAPEREREPEERSLLEF